MIGPRREILGAWNKPIWVIWDGLYWSKVWQFMQAEKNGAPVLKDQASWRKISGFALRIGRLRIFVQFRRRMK